MDTAYARYLLLVAIVAAGTAVLGTLLFIAIRGRRRKKHSSGIADNAKARNAASDIIENGNVSVFFDKHRNAVLIPYVPDIFGSGKATVDIIRLDMPYRSDELGHAVKTAMASCRNGKPADNRVLMRLLGSSGWKEFTTGRLSISVYCKDSKGIMLNSTVRTPEGAYVYISRTPEICLPPNTDSAELGDAVLELLKKCR
ncbi:MAG: hypothetical protein WAP56_09565 [Acetivibrionales bacterium]|jgi:hypothetical protein|nr:hypothetical protein [Bacillota bacterium]NLP07611.1 hypothetical protein [Clostridiaceae bacterium]HOA54233.1 hypothetical protein [Clostridiales bacterium]HQD30580.1 hypothetical protein [Clostridiales bacterium]